MLYSTLNGHTITLADLLKDQAKIKYRWELNNIFDPWKFIAFDPDKVKPIKAMLMSLDQERVQTLIQLYETKTYGNLEKTDDVYILLEKIYMCTSRELAKIAEIIEAYYEQISKLIFEYQKRIIILNTLQKNITEQINLVDEQPFYSHASTDPEQYVKAYGKNRQLLTTDETPEEFSLIKIMYQQNSITYKTFMLFSIEYSIWHHLFTVLMMPYVRPENLLDILVDFFMKCHIIYQCDPLKKDLEDDLNFYLFIYGEVIAIFICKYKDTLDQEDVSDYEIIYKLRKRFIATVLQQVYNYIHYFLKNNEAYDIILYYLKDRLDDAVKSKNKYMYTREHIQQIRWWLEQRKFYYENFKSEIEKEFSLGNNDYIVDIHACFVRVNQTPSYAVALTTIGNLLYWELQTLQLDKFRKNIDSNFKHI